MKILNHYRLKFVLSTMITALAAFSSCIDEGSDEIAGKGDSIFRFQVDDNFKLVAFDAVLQTRTIVSINRDAVSTSDLSKTASVGFAMDQAILDAYNTEHETEFEILPEESYELVGVSGSSFDFASGEFVKEIDLKLDPSKVDLSKQYALPFVLKDPSGEYKVSDGSGYAVIQIIIKNQYDGTYTEVGTLIREGVAPDALDTEVDLNTRGANTCVAIAGFPVFGNPGITYLLTVNPDNSVTISADPAGSVSIYAIDPPPTYDPATKTFVLNYEYLNASNLKRTFHTTLVRK